MSSGTKIWLPDDEGMEKTKLQSDLTDPKKSAFRKYQEITIGSPGILNFIKYELLISFFGCLPGAIGLFIRKIFYKRIFGKIGKNVIFGKSLTIRHPHKIHIGDFTVIDDYAVLDAKGTSNKGITIGKNVIIGRNTSLSCKNGNIIIGDNSNIAMNCFIQSAKDVAIGADVLLSAYCYIIGGGDHKTERTDIPIIAQGQVVRGIRIDDNCLLGAGVLIQDGIHIRKDVIVGAGAVVRDDIPAFSVAAGVPAKIIGKRK